MSKVISEKLASEVLGFEVTLIDDKYTSTTNKVRYVKNCGNDYYINIHELAHKCKEWASKEHGYVITQYPWAVKAQNGEVVKSTQSGKIYDINTVLEMCQWILENKGSNQG